MNFKKYLILGGIALGLGMTSCINDLDLQPNDPNIVPMVPENLLAMCYGGIAFSGISGPGSSYVSGLDAGTSAYTRCLFMLNEYPTDEVMFLWSDPGIPDLVVNTWGKENSIIYGAYSRFIGHIALCNQYLTNTKDDASLEENRAQVRFLRAYSYYNLMDMFGMTSFITEEAEVGEAPQQVSRDFIFNWIEGELKDIVDNRLISATPNYGYAGLDAAEALLARLYLNAEVFSGRARWADCQSRCENIIRRHTGKGFKQSGLANNYLYLFARDNDAYMPGGSKADENEILFGIAYDADMIQSYGGTTFIINSSCDAASSLTIGTSAAWNCFRAPVELTNKFPAFENDVRRSLWLTGAAYTDEFEGFTGDWNTCGGQAPVKYTGLNRNAAEDGGFSEDILSTTFATTDQPIIRLADVYLMYTECYVNGHVGDADKALKYINFIRERAGVTTYGYTDLNINNVMDERARELYYELTRRTDLIRNKMFAGPQQILWQYKGSLNDKYGTYISEKFNLFPIPQNVIYAQPEFQQNPGY